jgi:hypothetical protein
MADALQSLLAVIGAQATASIDSVTIDGDLFPSITVTKPLASGGGSGIGQLIAQKLRPRATIRFASETGIPPYVYAPYGNPEPMSEESALAVALAWGLGTTLILALAVKGFFAK